MEHGVGAAAMYEKMAAGRTSPDDLTLCSGATTETMSTTRQPTQNDVGTTGRDALESLDRPNELGVDGEGSVHFHSSYDERVVVVDEAGDIEETFDLAGKKLAGFIAHVDEHRGWETLRYKETFGEVLAEALAPTEGER